jgi:hypothetical protein
VQYNNIIIIKFRKSYLTQTIGIREITPSQFDSYEYSLCMKAVIVCKDQIEKVQIMDNVKSMLFARIVSM